MTLEIKNPDLLNFINNNINFFSFIKKEIANSEIICGAYFERAERELKEKILAKYKVKVLFNHDATNNISEIKISINSNAEILFVYKRNNLEDAISIEVKMRENNIFNLINKKMEDSIKLNPHSTIIYLEKNHDELLINYYSQYIEYHNPQQYNIYKILNEYLKQDFEKGMNIIRGNSFITQEDIDLFKLIKDVRLNSEIPNNYKYLNELKKINIKERKKNILKIW